MTSICPLFCIFVAEKSEFCMKQCRFFILAVVIMGVLGACNSRQQANGYVSELTSADSLSIRMGNYTLLKYYSERLGFNINYPSYLVHQELPETAGRQELFMMDDVSVSVMSERVDSMTRSPGQQLMGMGADLLEVTDGYSILRGVDDDWEYYAKVIEDSTRLVTIILRYYPEHEDAVIELKDWVKNFNVVN